MSLVVSGGASLPTGQSCCCARLLPGKTAAVQDNCGAQCRRPHPLYHQNRAKHAATAILADHITSAAVPFRRAVFYRHTTVTVPSHYPCTPWLNPSRKQQTAQVPPAILSYPALVSIAPAGVSRHPACDKMHQRNINYQLSIVLPVASYFTPSMTMYITPFSTTFTAFRSAPCIPPMEVGVFAVAV